MLSNTIISKFVWTVLSLIFYHCGIAFSLWYTGCSNSLHFSVDMRVTFHVTSTSLRELTSHTVTPPRWHSVCTAWITWVASSRGMSWVHINQSLVWLVKCVTPWMTMDTLSVKPWRRSVCITVHMIFIRVGVFKSFMCCSDLWLLCMISVDLCYCRL